MLRDLLSSRLIQGGLVFFVLVVGGSLLYSWHVHRATEVSDLGPTPQTVVSPIENTPATNTAPVDIQTEGVSNTPNANTERPIFSETEAETTDETKTLDMTDALLPVDIRTPQDPVLAKLHSEREALKQRQIDLNMMFQEHFATVVGRELTDADTLHGNLVSGNAEGLTEAEVIAELEDLRSRSENLLKAQVKWRLKYIQHTGKEYPGTEHWVPHEIDPEEAEKLLQYELGARGWYIVDP